MWQLEPSDVDRLRHTQEELANTSTTRWRSIVLEMKVLELQVVAAEVEAELTKPLPMQVGCFQHTL